MLNIDRLRRIKEIRERKAELRAEEKALNGELRLLEDQAFMEMMEEGVETLSVDDKTMYIHRELRPHSSDPAALADALVAEGYGDIVKETVHPKTLASFIREQAERIKEETGFRPTTDEILAALPDSISKHLNLFEQISVRSRSRRS